MESNQDGGCGFSVPIYSHSTSGWTDKRPSTLPVNDGVMVTVGSYLSHAACLTSFSLSTAFLAPAFTAQLCSDKSHTNQHCIHPITLPSKTSSVQLRHTQTQHCIHTSAFKDQLCSDKSHTNPALQSYLCLLRPALFSYVTHKPLKGSQ